MKKISLFVLITLAMVTITGCSIINPYNSEFSCKKTYKGECMQTQEAYESSLSGGDLEASANYQTTLDDKENREKAGSNSGKECKSCNKGKSGCKNCQGSSVSTTSNNDELEGLYKKSQYEELTKIIDAPKTPMVKPQEVMRILLLGYTGNKNEFFSHRYMYIFVGDPQWVISPNDEIK